MLFGVKGRIQERGIQHNAWGDSRVGNIVFYNSLAARLPLAVLVLSLGFGCIGFHGIG